MNTYYMGRFGIDVPLEIKQVVQSHQFRYATLKEFTWPVAANRNTAREEVWKQKIRSK